jgi:hypothetical protein
MVLPLHVRTWKNTCPWGIHNITLHYIKLNHITSHHTTSDCMRRLTLLKDNFQFTYALLLSVCSCKPKYIHYMRTWHTYILWNIKIHTRIHTSRCTHCVPCMHAHMHTNILEPKSLRSTLPQHHSYTPKSTGGWTRWCTNMESKKGSSWPMHAQEIH